MNSRTQLRAVIWLLLTTPWLVGQTEPASLAGNAKVAEILKNFAGRGVMADDSPPTPPEESIERFQLRPGCSIDLVASEPDISQPLFLSWDSRGRMWVVQYRQYQYPAGLKVIRFDQHLRAVFDKTPEPPPRGTPGADKITVFEDTDGDGRYDTSKDVLTGLNIATSVQVGHGGIWVLNPPYLLFYPDANGDDEPDSDPEVVLSGFGLQDTHSVANSLIWGPDGWLYAANGSTTGGTISSEVTKGISFQGQCIWRYHPDSKVFEIYAEGGGNTFSCEIDAKGRVFSGTNGGDTRGFYYPQGAYFQKNWGKHGPLTNPYAFGFFQQMKSEGDSRRFPQAFAIYDGGLFPESFKGTVIAPNAMLNRIWHSELLRDGSYYRTVDQPNLAESSDRWFRPVYCGVGPDGGIYVADWYDTRLSHVSPTDDWHKSSGRVYRIRPTGSSPQYREGDLARLDAEVLVSLLNHPNKWVRQRATLELGWRGDRSVLPRLIAGVEQQQAALECLWAVHLLGELSPDRASKWLEHDDADIRRWVVRLLGDRASVALPGDSSRAAVTSDTLPLTKLAALALREPEVQVRSQLASTAKRLPASFAFPLVESLLRRSEDVEDPHLPLLIWWALEAHAENWDQVQTMLGKTGFWELPLMRSVIISRLMRRYAAAGTPDDLQRCARLVELAPDATARELLIAGLNEAFQGRALPPLPASLDQALSEYQAARGNAGIVIALRQGNPAAVEAAIKSMRDESIDLGLRIELARACGEISHPTAVDTLLGLATGRYTDEPAYQRVAIQSLSLYDDDRIPDELTRAFDGQISAEHELRATGCRTLASRKSWATALLNEVNQWRLKPSDVPADVVQRLRTYDDPDMVASVEQAFGKPVAISAPEKLAEMRRLTELLGGRVGDADAGQIHFTKKCATCHRLFGQGDSIGPALDSYDRGSLKFWLPAMVEPSLEIREGYQSYKAVTLGGRVVTGMIAAQDPKTITIRTADNQNVVLARSDLEELRAIDTSLMPDNLLQDLTDQQIQDLFAYLSIGARR